MRVNVETTAITRAKRLSKRLAISHAECLGHLVFLWMSSQDEQSIEAGATDISFWFDPDSKFGEEQLIHELGACGFIKKSDTEPLFEINGNRKHVDKLCRLRKNSVKGGQVNRAKWDAKRLAKKPDLDSPIQYNPKQSNPKQSKKINAPSASRISDAAIDSLYSRYPRKKGKLAGYKKVRATIKDQETLTQVAKAIRIYTEQCRAEGTEKKHVMYFGTFMNCWEEFLDPDSGTSTVDGKSVVGIETILKAKGEL